MKLLAVGDMHLGRQPARLDVLAREGLEARQLGPAKAWRRVVEHAVTQNVDAVVLAGDVVEQEDDFYEAYADLRAGVERLTNAGVQVAAVAGNHDVKVLPRLADAVPGFTLLGRGGRWEAKPLRSAAGDMLELIGWSFPESVVRSSPLAAAAAQGFWAELASLRHPKLGLLHCDRDQPGSRHAPVRARELNEAPVDGWLLGHIHRADPLVGPRPIGYLGSLCGLDPGEPGPHGPWLVEVTAHGLRLELVPLAPLRWETLDVRVDGLGAAEDVHPQVTRALDELHRRLAAEAHQPRAVGCRVRFVGRTSLRHALERALHADDPRHSPQPRDGIYYFVHAWELRALPPVDLAHLAQGQDPAALLARRIQLLRGPDTPEKQRLVERAEQRLADVAARPHFATLANGPLGSERIVDILEAAAWRALDALWAQKEGPG